MTYDEKLQAMKQFGFGEVTEREFPAKRYFELTLDVPIGEAAEMAAQFAALAIDTDGYFTMQVYRSLEYCHLSLIVAGSNGSTTEVNHHEHVASVSRT